MNEENELERALRLASDDPANRPDFYRLLVDASVYVIGRSGAWDQGMKTVAVGEEIEIQNWVKDDGSAVIPFFTSLEALRNAVAEEANYLLLPARSLFELTKGATLVLNPYSLYGKEFPPPEVEALLIGGSNRLPEQRITQKDTQVLLGQPKEYPSRMVDALTTFFSGRGHVKAAYLALMQDPSRDEKPHLVLGILMDDGEAHFDETLFREAGNVAADTVSAGEIVDLYRINEDDGQGLSGYFLKSVKPFYEATWGARLKEGFSAGHA